MNVRIDAQTRDLVLKPKNKREAFELGEMFSGNGGSVAMTWNEETGELLIPINVMTVPRHRASHKQLKSPNRVSETQDELEALHIGRLRKMVRP